jgi:hypothetical protein
VASEDLIAQVRGICRSITDGSVEPVSGARRIWVLLAEADYPPEADPFRVFVGMVSEIDDHPEDRTVYTRQIIDEARSASSAAVFTHRSLPPEVFEQGESFLWRAAGLEAGLRAELYPQTFSAWTFAPPFVTDEELAALQLLNRRWESEPSGTWEMVLRYLEGRMRDLSATWVVPDSLREVTDSSFNPSSEYFIVGTTPYYVTREPDARKIEQAWIDGGSAAGELGLLTSTDVPRTEPPVQQLERIAECACDVVVEAYDHPRRVIFFSRPSRAPV